MRTQKASVREIVPETKVFVRVDFNVPQNGDGSIKDTKKIDETLKTIMLLRSKGAKIILASHLGRPDGAPDPKLSLGVVYEYLKQKFPDGVVKFAPDCIGPETQKMADELKSGEILLLENLRFHKGEEANDPEFAGQLAALAGNGGEFVEDAWGTIHRNHASTVGVPKILPGYMGLLVEEEAGNVANFIKDVQRPFVVVMGGSKVKDKVKQLKGMAQQADVVVVLGKMGNTFLAEQGVRMKPTNYEEKGLQAAKEVRDYVSSQGKVLIGPLDVRARVDDPDGPCVYDFALDCIPESGIAMGIGPKTIEKVCETIEQARTVFFNGTPTVYDDQEFAEGTRALLEAAVRGKRTVLAGGGDMGAAVKKFGFEDRIPISTGGGATNEVISGEEPYALDALRDAVRPIHEITDPHD